MRLAARRRGRGARACRAARAGDAPQPVTCAAPAAGECTLELDATVRAFRSPRHLKFTVFVLRVRDAKGGDVPAALSVSANIPHRRHMKPLRRGARREGAGSDLG